MDYKHASDIELLQRCQQDDMRAYTTLFQRYFKSMYAFALKHSGDEYISEELAMDVMYRFWEKRAQVRDGATLRSYLFVSMRRAVIDHWRKKEVSSIDIAELSPETLPESDAADTQLKSLEMERLYRESLARLNPKEREVFLLSREEECTYPQIAERMGISVNTVKTHMSSGLRTFRLHLSAYTDLILLLIVACLAHPW